MNRLNKYEVLIMFMKDEEFGSQSERMNEKNKRMRRNAD